MRYEEIVTISDAIGGLRHVSHLKLGVFTLKKIKRKLVLLYK